ncbi:MAG: hypothetical protein AAGU21_17990 [Solidesulfovibrio sp.]|uniref:hypothetical protein n=1 Tax=Solidesulfovibrio sp. TaxID=2910990 RepID=UPI003157F57B
MHSINDDEKLQALIDISLKAVENKNYEISVIASDFVLQINPLHCQAITLKCIGLYQLGHYSLALIILKYMFNNFDKQEIIAMKNLMNQYDLPSSIIHTQLMINISKTINRKKLIANITKLGTVSSCIVIILISIRYIF